VIVSNGPLKARLVSKPISILKCYVKKLKQNASERIKIKGNAEIK
jgi:hypothetical protein